MIKVSPMQYRETDKHTAAEFKTLADAFEEIYATLLGMCPKSAERTMAVRKLQESRMWANASLVFDETEYEL